MKGWILGLFIVLLAIGLVWHYFSWKCTVMTVAVSALILVASFPFKDREEGKNNPVGTDRYPESSKKGL